MLGKERKASRQRRGSGPGGAEVSLPHVPPLPPQPASQRHLLNSRDFTGPRSGGG